MVDVLLYLMLIILLIKERVCLLVVKWVLLRCNETIGCEVDENSYSRCIEYFKEDVKKYNFKHILLLGDAARRFFNVSIYTIIDCVLVSGNNRYYSVNYSPLVKNVNDKLGNAFENNLKQWYGDVLNKHYINKIINLWVMLLA